MSLSRSASSPPRSSIPADERLHCLIEWLRCGRKLTAAAAAAAFGVSRRTITRDLAHLRDVLSINIAFDPSQQSYVLVGEHTALPFLAFPSLAPVLLDAKPCPNFGDAEAPGSVTVRFSADAIQAYLARGGHVPPDAASEDGTLTARFHPPNLDEFTSYVLSRGHHIEVLGPADFRRRVHMEIRRMLERYDEEPESDA